MTQEANAEVVLEEADVRGVLALAGLMGFFLFLAVMLYMVFVQKLTIDDLMTVLTYVGTFVSTGVGWYFGSKSAEG